jgi:hypothetical protein
LTNPQNLPLCSSFIGRGKQGRWKGKEREMEGKRKGDKASPPPSPRERELKSLTEKRHIAMRGKAY